MRLVPPLLLLPLAWPALAQQPAAIPAELTVEEMLTADELDGAEGEQAEDGAQPDATLTTLPLAQALAQYNKLFLEIRTPVSYTISARSARPPVANERWQVWRGGLERLDSATYARVLGDEALTRRMEHEAEQSRRRSLWLAGGGVALLTGTAIALLMQEDDPVLETATEQTSLEEYWALWFNQRTQRTVTLDNRSRRQSALVLGFGGVLFLGSAQATINASLEQQSWPGSYASREEVQAAIDAHNLVLKRQLGLEAPAPEPAPDPDEDDKTGADHDGQ